jgi:hypothetical protein
MTGNTTIRENRLLTRALAALCSRLPPGWSATPIPEPYAAERRPDLLVQLRAPDGAEIALPVAVRLSLSPKLAVELARSLPQDDGAPLLAIAPWISPATRDRLKEAGVLYLDPTGNARLVLARPGLYVETTGADRDPEPERRIASLKGEKAAQLVRALSRSALPVGVRALAREAGTTPGYTSKVFTMLDAEATITREAGRVTTVDLARLLQLWAEDAPLAARARATMWIDPRGLTGLVGRLKQSTTGYAITGSLAAARVAPVAASRLASIYVDDADAFANAHGLRRADAGANVVLLEPEEGGVYDGAWTDDGLRYAALPQVAADLYASPGRGPAEADALCAWMNAHPGVRRG